MPRTSRVLTGALAVIVTCAAQLGTAQAIGAVVSNAAVHQLAAWQPLHEPGVGGRITSLDVNPESPDRVLVGGDMLGIGLSDDGGSSWQPTFGLASYEVAEFTHNPTSPEEVWAGTMSGPTVSLDGGRTWSARRNGMFEVRADTYSAPVETVLFTPGDPQRLLAFGGSQRLWPAPGSRGFGVVWVSRDGGQKWSRLGLIAGGGNVVGVSFAAGDPRVIVAAVQNRGMWRSTDGGATWQPSSTGLPSTAVTDVTAHGAGSSDVWVSVGASASGRGWRTGGVFKSKDGGLTWAASSRGLNQTSGPRDTLTSQYLQVVSAPKSPDVLYTSDGSADRSSVFRSTDGGDSWQPIINAEKRKKQAPDPYASGPTADAITVDPQDSNRVFIGQSEYMLRTTDGGDTWSDVSSVPSSGGFAGRGFSGLVGTRVRFDPRVPGHLVVLGMDGGNFVQTLDGGRSWRRTMGTWDNWNGAYDASYGSSRGKIFVLLGQRGEFNGIATSSDDGATWRVSEGKRSGLPARGTVFENRRPTAIHAIDDQHVLTTIDGALYRSSDSGATWQVVSSGLRLTDIAGDPSDPSRVVVAGAAGVYRSFDGGSTLQLAPGSPSSADRLTVDTRGDVLASQWQRSGGVWRLRDGTWTQIFDERYSYDVAVDPTDPDRIAVATFDRPYHDVTSATGVWVSLDGGRTFTSQNLGLPVLRISTLAFDPSAPGRLVVGTGGRGFFETTLRTAQPADVAGPVATTVQPGAGARLATANVDIAGLAADPSGVARVKVAIRDGDRDLWLQADGSWGSRVWMPAKLDPPVAVTGAWHILRTLPDGNYFVSVRSEDILGNQANGGTRAFSVETPDATPPTSDVNRSPVPTAGMPYRLSGSANDDRKLAAVDVCVKNPRTGLWLRRDGTWGDLEWLTTTGGTGTARSGWQLAQALADDDYAVGPRATDASGNVERNRVLTQVRMQGGDLNPPVNMSGSTDRDNGAGRGRRP